VCRQPALHLNQTSSKTTRISLLSGALCALALILPSASSAAPVGLDPSFGQAGAANPGIAPQDAAVLPDGRVVVAGRRFDTNTVGLVMLSPQGTLAVEFGEGPNTSVFGLPGAATAVRVAVDGQRRIVVAVQSAVSGSPSETYIARVHTHGALDPTFGTDGIAPVPNFSPAKGLQLALDADRPAIAGSIERGFRFARLTEAGGLDSEFGGDGIADITGPERGRYGYTTAAFDLAVGETGDLIVVGERFQAIADFPTGAAAALRSDGEPKTTFGNTEVPGFMLDIGNAPVAGVAVLDDGRFVFAGSDRHRCSYQLRAFHQDGSPDEDFGSGGLATASGFAPCDGHPWYSETYARGIVVQDGGLVVVGSFGDWDVEEDRDVAAVRFDAAGVRDMTFGSNGIARTDFASDSSPAAVAIAPEGKIVVPGATPNIGPWVARFLRDGEGGGDPDPDPDPSNDSGSGGVAGGVAQQGVEVHKLVIPRTRSALARVGVRALASCAFDCKLLLEVRVKPRVAAAMGLKGTLLGRGTAAAKGGQRRWVLAKLKPTAKRALLSWGGSGRLQVKVSAAGPDAGTSAVYRSAGL
jgi:uncharacterized delta-60 repeat protein